MLTALFLTISFIGIFKLLCVVFEPFHEIWIIFHLYLYHDFPPRYDYSASDTQFLQAMNYADSRYHYTLSMSFILNIDASHDFSS